MPHDRATAQRFFRKRFELHKRPESARLRITCDNGYTLFLNGRQLGSGSRWEQIDQYDVVDLLREGDNELNVHAVNQGDSAGLIAELTADDVLVSTNHTWQCAATEAGPMVAAEVLSNFPDSLWAKHTPGPPRLQPMVAGPTQPARLKVQPLSSRWHNNPSILPFDTRWQVQRPAGWYRFESPPGLRCLTITALGDVQAWADGDKLTPVGRNRFVVSQPSASPVQVAVRIRQQRGCYGGAALPEPIVLECGTGLMAPGDWSKIDGLASYSGGAWYRNTVTLDAPQASGSVILDLGEVVASAEVRVNGRPAGIRVAPPWKVDITDLVQPGENHVEILVYNTLANHYLTIPTRYRGATTSGLLGRCVWN